MDYLKYDYLFKSTLRKQEFSSLCARQNVLTITTLKALGGISTILLNEEISEKKKVQAIHRSITELLESLTNEAMAISRKLQDKITSLNQQSGLEFETSGDDVGEDAFTADLNFHKDLIEKLKMHMLLAEQPAPTRKEGTQQQMLQQEQPQAQLQAQQNQGNEGNNNNNRNNNNRHDQPPPLIPNQSLFGQNIQYIALHEAKIKRYKLDSSTPSFNGNGNLKNWLFVIDKALKNAKVPYEEILDIITTKVEGLPLAMLKKLVDGNAFATWDDFQHVLMTNFRAHNEDQLIREKLKDIKHYGEFNKFLKRFLSLINEISLTTPDEILFFQDALQEDTKLEVMKAKPKTLEHAIEIAQMVEQCKARLNKEANNTNRYTGKKQINFNKSKNNSDNKNNNKQDTSHGKENNNQSRVSNEKKNKSNVVCYGCKQTGHYRNKCPNKEVNATDSNSDQDSNTENEDSEVNVISASNTSENLIKIPVTVNGMECKALLDTGAMVSVISENVVRKLTKVNKIAAEKSNIKITTILNESSEENNVTNLVDLIVYGNEFKMKFIILESNYDLILGMNWFQAAQAGIAIGQDGQKIFKLKDIIVNLSDEFVSLNKVENETELDGNLLKSTKEIIKNNDQEKRSKELIVYPDASGNFISGVLAQIDEQDNEVEIANFSKVLKGAKKYYSLSEKKCLAMIWTFKSFSKHLRGIQFKVVTDHTAFDCLHIVKEPTSRLERWNIDLQEFDYVVQEGNKATIGKQMKTHFQENQLFYNLKTS